MAVAARGKFKPVSSKTDITAKSQKDGTCRGLGSWSSSRLEQGPWTMKPQVSLRTNYCLAIGMDLIWIFISSELPGLDSVDQTGFKRAELLPFT